MRITEQYDLARKWVRRHFTFSSVQFSHSVVYDSLRPHEPQQARPPCPSPTPGVYPNPCPLSRWCHPTVSFSVVPFSSHLQSFPASGTFPISQFFTSGGQTIGVSASTSVLPMNTQDWSPLGWTGWISLQSKGLSWVFSNTTVQRHQFFGASHFRNKETMHTVMEVPPEHPKGGCDVSDVKYWSPGLGTLCIIAPQRRYYFLSSN